MTKKKIFATILLPLVVAGSGLTLFAETAKAFSINSYSNGLGTTYSTPSGSFSVTPYINGTGMRYHIQ